MQRRRFITSSTIYFGRKAVIVISSELPELLGICSRIITIADGKITGEFNEKASQETLLAVMIGGGN
ncbi:MAG: hypothetical protein ACLVKR_01925 [Lachnospiraceae bacterium]